MCNFDPRGGSTFADTQPGAKILSAILDGILKVALPVISMAPVNMGCARKSTLNDLIFCSERIDLPVKLSLKINRVTRIISGLHFSPIYGIQPWPYNPTTDTTEVEQTIIFNLPLNLNFTLQADFEFNSNSLLNSAVDFGLCGIFLFEARMKGKEFIGLKVRKFVHDPYTLNFTNEILSTFIRIGALEHLLRTHLDPVVDNALDGMISTFNATLGNYFPVTLPFALDFPGEINIPLAGTQLFSVKPGYFQPGRKIKDQDAFRSCVIQCTSPTSPGAQHPLACQVRCAEVIGECTPNSRSPKCNSLNDCITHATSSFTFVDRTGTAEFPEDKIACLISPVPDPKATEFIYSRDRYAAYVPFAEFRPEMGVRCGFSMDETKSTLFGSGKEVKPQSGGLGYEYDCRYACDHDSTCKSFDLEKGTGKCFLYPRREDVTDKNITVPDSRYSHFMAGSVCS